MARNSTLISRSDSEYEIREQISSEFSFCPIFASVLNIENDLRILMKNNSKFETIL